MIQKIKERIESIRRGEVPEGYKRTKVGIIPNGWGEGRLKLYFKRLMRKNTENNTNVLTISAQYGLISQEEFFNKSVAGEDKRSYYLLLKGDFAYNKSYSSGYPYGAIKRLKDSEKGIVSPLYICLVATNGIVADYFAQYFEVGLLNREIHSFAQEGARNHGLLNISVEDFFNSHIVFAPEAEQQKIAEILQAQDKVIELKEKLLVQKQQQKKYLMQQLLTGKIRLPGFTGKWRQVALNVFLNERKTYSSKGKEYPHVTLSNEGIYPKSERYDRDHLVRTEDKQYKITHYGDICYNPANLKFGAICINAFGSAIFSPIYVTFEVKNGANLWFLGELMTSKRFISAVRKYEEGTVYERMAVKPSDLLLHQVFVPSLEEQTAIAEVLSTADAEIGLLKKDIEQEKLKKKSLMQLLLTGIVRV